jgi:tetratricopeptide (TPR) repeat protein
LSGGQRYRPATRIFEYGRALVLQETNLIFRGSPAEFSVLISAARRDENRLSFEMGTRKTKAWQRALFALGVAASLISTTARAQIISAETPDFTARIKVLAVKLREAPTNAGVQNEARALGIELLKAMRYEEAAALFVALRDAAPSDPATLYGGALALFNLRRIAEAEVWARAAVDKSLGAAEPGNAAAERSPRFGSVDDAFVLVGIILAAKGDNTGSIAALSRAVELAPGSFDAQFALGRALYGAGDPIGAARAFRASVALRPTHAEARFFLCTALERAGDNLGALAIYREFVTIAPNIAMSHLGLGVLLVKQGATDQDEGIRELEKALAIDDKLYEGHVSLGRALIRARRPAESISHLKRAAELAPDNPEPHYQMAIAYGRLGKRQEAEAESAVVKQIHQSRRSAQASKPETPTPPDQQF